MNEKLTISLVQILLTVLALFAGYYFGSSNFKKEKAAIEPKKELKIAAEPKPEEKKEANFSGAKIISINNERDQTEIVAIGLPGILNNPVSATKKTILVNGDTIFTAGKLGANEPTESITLSELQVGDNLLVLMGTKKSAIMIKKILG